MNVFAPGTPSPLTVKKLSHLLHPIFSEEGSNRKKVETAIYSNFVKYMREAASKYFFTIIVKIKAFNYCINGYVMSNIRSNVKPLRTNLELNRHQFKTSEQVSGSWSSLALNQNMYAVYI